MVSVGLDWSFQMLIEAAAKDRREQFRGERSAHASFLAFSACLRERKEANHGGGRLKTALARHK